MPTSSGFPESRQPDLLDKLPLYPRQKQALHRMQARNAHPPTRASTRAHPPAPARTCTPPHISPIHTHPPPSSHSHAHLLTHPTTHHLTPPVHPYPLPLATSGDLSQMLSARSDMHTSQKSQQRVRSSRQLRSQEQLPSTENPTHFPSNSAATALHELLSGLDRTPGAAASETVEASCFGNDDSNAKK